MAGLVTTGTGVGVEEFSQLEWNLDYLRQNLLDPEASPNLNGTVEGVLTMPSGALRYADVHVLGFTPTIRVAHVIQGVLDISIPSGGFV